MIHKGSGGPVVTLFPLLAFELLILCMLPSPLFSKGLMCFSYWPTPYLAIGGVLYEQMVNGVGVGLGGNLE